MMISKNNPEQPIQTDNGILADIWDVLWKENTFRSLDMGSISIHVKDGEVYLTGHLARENNLTLIEGIAQSVVEVLEAESRPRSQSETKAGAEIQRVPKMVMAQAGA